MINLLKKYCSEGKYSEAVIVGQNAFNRYPNNKEFFEAY